MNYKFPEPFEFDIMFCTDITLRAIEVGAQWLDDNPDFTPEYVNLMGRILADNDETVAMQQEIFKLAGVTDDDLEGIPFVGLNFRTFATAMLAIKDRGWNTVLEEFVVIQKHHAEHKEANNV